MYKLLSLTIIATVVVAMPHDFPAKADTPVHADFPMPVLPWDFEATAYAYIWSNGRLAPANTWTTQRYSSSMNKIFDMDGIIDENGDEIVNSSESTDVNSESAVEYTEGKPCVVATNVQQMNVNQTIATFFDSFTYAGLQYAPWELTRVKYHRLDKESIQYFYK